MTPRRPRPEVHWRAHGRGPALVLLNGWATSGLAWPAAWVRALEREFRVIRIDNRGTGWSRHARTPFTMADLAGDVLAVLDAEGVEQAALFGLSMGGMIAQETALLAPERIPALVLSGTRPPTPEFHPTVASPVAWQLMRPLGPRETKAAYFRRIWSLATAEGFADRHPEVIEELVRQNVERPTPRALLVQQLWAVMAWGHAERLAGIRARTVVVHGEEDAFIPVENGRALGRLVPGATYVELPGVGHLAPHEAPDRVRALVTEAAGA
jgi:pimeloyl-ACP methyl ester carboxylesterase